MVGSVPRLASTLHMPYHRKAPSVGNTCLAWLLLLAVALMGLTVTRQQALGPLHSHTVERSHNAPPSAIGAALSDWARDWQGRRQHQKMSGHSQMLLTFAPFPERANRHSDIPHTHTNNHTHDALERHHHAADDASVVALDGAAAGADAADSPSNGASLLLISLAAPGGGLAVPATSALRSSWPVGRIAVLSSRSVPPPLRPPAI